MHVYIYPRNLPRITFLNCMVATNIYHSKGDILRLRVEKGMNDGKYIHRRLFELLIVP